MIEMTPKTRERLLDSLRLAGEWYVNTQNTEENPWGGVHDSADLGRLIYEYYPARKWCRGMGVWGQAVAIMGLYSAGRMTRHESFDFKKTAQLAAGYLKTLQIINPARPEVHGAIFEHTPQSAHSFPRDGATGGMGFIAMYRETGEEEYLERAKLFAKWYHDYGSDKNGWPYGDYDLIKGEPKSLGRYVHGDWQAGGGLVYYYLYKLTGEQVWMDYLRQMIDPLLDMYERAKDSPIVSGFHGEVEISYGNDDFAIIALMAAYRHWKEPRMLQALQGHIRRLWTIADADGSYPSFAGTFVCTINNHEYLQLCLEEKLVEDIAALKYRIMKSALQGLTQQEARLHDIRAYGGFYGQSSYGVSRDRIHHRSTGYAMIMLARLLGGNTPYYSSWGWEK
ncbi:MAG: hypothetical protein FWD53_03355 [Phycisphaerales bacterium]|nr:hypothetical protein [Phycisphaerales bacterium]